MVELGDGKLAWNRGTATLALIVVQFVVIHNLCVQVVCNNLILKYVEDDLVLRNAATFILFYKKF